ncbi:MAG: YbaK/EbsC family protein [Candidatus Gracilibacteria bacterium]|nr:YbaK/EbsC family protein [Candidatus Gracilibacteria bacterium]
MNTNYRHIIDIIHQLGIAFQEIDHMESHSCDESKVLRSRANMDGVGSKNLVFHAKGHFFLVTTTGDTQIKARNFKHEFGSKDIRFASQEEITNLMQATIGSIPPFGFENKTLPIYVDSGIFGSENFCFNPNDPTKSIQIRTKDLRTIYDTLPNPVRYFKQTEEGFDILEDV